MRYFAILKDSIREARDSKFLLVLFILSTLAIGVVSTLGFRPKSAQETFQQFFDHRIREALREADPVKVFTLDPKGYCRLEAVELVQGEPESPESDYALTIAHQAGWDRQKRFMKRFQPDLKIDEPVQIDPGTAHRQAVEDVELIFRPVVELGLLKVDTPEVLPKKDGVPGTNHIRVIVHGTAQTLRIWASERRILAWRIPETQIYPLGYQIYYSATLVMGFGTWVAVLLGVIITSSFIPNMLRKGTVDMLLVKPIHRSVLLIYKYLGGLTFILAITTYAVVGIWFVIGLRTGLWGLPVLIWIPGITLFFAIFYSISTLMGVLTRSTITSILVTCSAWFLFFIIGYAEVGFQRVRDLANLKETAALPKELADEAENLESWGYGVLATIVHTLHAGMPRTTDLDRLNNLCVYCAYFTGRLSDLGRFEAGRTELWESLLVSFAWIIIFLGLACWRFTAKDY